MNYTEIIKIAKEKLDGIHHQNILYEIDKCVRGASTGGEIAGCIAVLFKSLRDNSEASYGLMGKDIDNYLAQFTFKK